MSDLTDEELARCEQTSDFCSEDFWALLSEVKRRRAAVAADEERVRSVVSEALSVAVAECFDSTADYISAIADRAAKQLATAAVRLSDEEHVRSVVLQAAWQTLDCVFTIDPDTMRAAILIADRAAKRLVTSVKPERNLIPFDAARQEYVNTVTLKGGEVPMLDRKTLEQLADHCNRMICSFWDWPGNEYSNGELAYRVALGALRRMQELATAAMRLSDEERGVVSRMVGRVYELVPMGNGDEAALGVLLDRLLSTGAKP